MTRRWTREELLDVMGLYCQLPFGRMHARNPEIMDLSQRIGRTANAVALKMVNFASLDESIPAGGMQNSSKLDREIWSEVSSDWTAFIDRIEHPLKLDESEHPARSSDTISSAELGLDVTRTSKARINQHIFRNMVLASYENRCAITGIDNRALLVASHIIPWAARRDTRLDPSNGLCLNALHDVAFDKGLIALTDDCQVIVSSEIRSHRETGDSEFFKNLERVPLRLPSKFRPHPDYITYHRENIFRG